MADKVWLDRKSGKVVKSQPEEGTQLDKDHAERLYGADSGAKTAESKK